MSFAAVVSVAAAVAVAAAAVAVAAAVVAVAAAVVAEAACCGGGGCCSCGDGGGLDWLNRPPLPLLRLGEGERSSVPDAAPTGSPVGMDVPAGRVPPNTRSPPTEVLVRLAMLYIAGSLERLPRGVTSCVWVGG